jgi:hypothetical protein
MNMKRLITMTICTIVCMATFGATVQRAILSHQGKLTQFDQNHWQEAIEQAVAGDTVFFTAGAFPGDLTITKAITLIGAGVGADDAFYKDTDIATAYAGCAKAGESTTIEGNIAIAIPGNITLSRTLLENIRLSGNGIAFTEPVTSPVIKRCQVGMIYTNWWSGGTLSASAEVTNLSLENCYIWNVSFENFENPDVHNCYFDKIEPTREGTQFTNCAIMDIWGTSNCTFENCIVHFATGSSNTCLNCLYDENLGNATVFNSWQVGGGQCLTKAQLQEGGYIGTDGTVVGPLGGPAPFTLIPAQPYVSSSLINYNKTTKKLTVNATVNKGK